MKSKIFVSSTIDDLPSERKAAFKGIMNVPAIPIMSERTFNAMDKNSFEACLSKVRESNIYILILGGKYGFEYEGKSITEWEYETANSIKIPILVFNLSYLEKEEKQKQFAKKAGDFSTGRFWADTNDAYELEQKITDSIRELIKEIDLARYDKKENLYPNLIPITFPKRLFIARRAINRDEIISKSWETNFKLKKKCSDMQLTKRAVLFHSEYCPEDFYTFENQIISFRNLNDKNEPLNSIIEDGTVEELDCFYIYSVSNDYENHFKSLLRNSLVEFFRGRKIYRVNEKKKDIYRFAMLNISNPSIRKVKWKKDKKASKRQVIYERKSKEDEHIICYRHLAFKFYIEHLDNSWYVTLNPTWSFTSNGKRKSKFEASYLSGIKEKENSQAVYNHFRFLNYFFNYVDLFNPQSEFIRFKTLPFLEFSPAVKEEDFI